MRDENLTEAVRLVGGNAAVAKIFGISREAVGQWDRCPAERVLGLSDATGGKVTPEQLRPDIYRPRSQPSAAPNKEATA